jgi:hypothetical protein
MGRSKLPKQFGIIDKRVWGKIENFDKQFLFKYNYHRKKLDDIDDEIKDFEIIIENLKKDKLKHQKRCEEIWKENKHYHSDYGLKYNISKNDKYSSIRDREGFNKEGKSKTQLLKERKFMGRYWLINVKHKGGSKSIHCGLDDSIKELIIDKLKIDKSELEDTTLMKTSKGREETVGENNIKTYINFLIKENLEDKLIESNEKGINFFNMKIKFNDLID